MDSGHARNYWRKAFVGASEGRFSEQEFDEWFPGSPGYSDREDLLLEAFEQMIEAVNTSKISSSTKRR